MSGKKIIDAKIDAASNRRKLQRGWQNMWLGLLIGVCFWLASLSVYKLAPVPQTTMLWAGVIGLALPLAGLLLGLAKRFASSDTARWLDREIGLKERLSTAVEMSEISSKTSAWSALMISDAAKAAGDIETSKLLPLRLPKVCHWTLLALAACVGLGFVPEHRSQAHLDQQRDSVIIEDVGQNLTALTKMQVQLSPPHFNPTEEALDSVQELGREFKKGKLGRDEALARLSSLAERLRDQSSKIGYARTLKKMQQAAQNQATAGLLKKAEVQRQLDELKKNLGAAKEVKQEQLNSLKSKMDDLKDAAAQLPDASSPEGQQARLELAKSLAGLANMADKMGMEMPNINEALNTLKSGDMDQFLKNMDFAGEDLQKIADLAKALQNMQMQMPEIGKTLSEQLKNGQVPAAIKSLQKMTEQLASAQLAPEQIEKMIQELQEALGPAEDFGESSKCLSDAKGKAKEGDKAGASLALAKAAEELKKMLQQLGDMENMMAALQNLERAQLAVGNCQSFGSCKKPGVGPSNKPGSGVGTWGNDSYQLTPEDLAQRWDNSGFSRPDMDARGTTDRGVGKVRDDMVSSRIEGKINPKGSMPSITLRGMSITGSSKVQLLEAVTAAQSDASNSLNQDKVPRAYRGSVRDYFDDLKE